MNGRTLNCLLTDINFRKEKSCKSIPTEKKITDDPHVKEAPPVGGLKVVRAFTILGRGGLMEFDAEFKFAKIQNSHVEGGGGGEDMEFDTEFKFAKIQNYHVEGEGGGGGARGI